MAFAVQFLAADRAEGLELRQFVRRAVDGVVAAANDHGLVGIAVEKTDQHFLTDAGQGDVAPAGTGPVVGDAHPAGAAVVILALAIPGELQAHATVFVAVDFFAGRADHGGDLRAFDAGFGAWWRLPFDVVGNQCGGEAVASAHFTAGRFFFHRGVLAAGVFDAHGAPANVEVFTWVPGQVKRQPRHQACIVAADFGGARIAAQALQAGLGERLAGGVVFVAAGVVVAFVVGALVLQLARLFVLLQVVAWVGEGVIALGLLGTAHLLAVGEAVQRRLGLIATGVGLVHQRFALDHAKTGDMVGLDQLMSALAVLEDRQQAFFGGQALVEVPVEVTGLYAVFTGQVGFGQALGAGAPAAFGGQLFEDLRHAALLENTPVRLQGGAGQLRFDHGAVGGAAKTGLALLETTDQAVHVARRLLALPDGEGGGLIEQLREVGGGRRADQVHGQAIQFAKAFGEFKRDHIEVDVGSRTEGKAHVAQVRHRNSCGQFLGQVFRGLEL
ncbi:hypothetical protein D3C85_525790 [compost metagenome]